MKVIICFIILFITNISYSSDRFKIYGNTDYTKKESESLTTTLTGEYKLQLLDLDSDGVYDIFLSGKIDHTYDYFGKIINVNVFTTLQIEF